MLKMINVSGLFELLNLYYMGIILQYICKSVSKTLAILKNNTMGILIVKFS